MKQQTQLIITALFLCIATLSFAQRNTSADYELGAGTFEFKAGIGLMSTFVSINSKSEVPPVSFVLNYKIKQHFSIGAYLGYSSTGYKNTPEEWNDNPERLFLTNDFYLTGLRAEGHWNQDRIDFYGGAMLGYNFSKINTNITDKNDRPEGITIKEDSSMITYSGYMGLRYAATPKLGIYGELGYGASLVNLGVSFRL